jgi:uncharacterized protein (TIGR03437 family)
MSGTWQIVATSSVFSIQTVAIGQITENSYGSISGTFNVTGNPCSTFAAASGTVLKSLGMGMTVMYTDYETVDFEGTLSADGGSANGTYSATPLGGCTNHDKGTWTGTRTGGVITAVSNAASGSTAIAPGSIVSIYGYALAASASGATSVPLPQLYENHGFAMLDSQRQDLTLSLFYWSPLQVNALIPATVNTGSASLGQLTCPSTAGGNCTGTATQALTVVPQAAGIFQNPTPDCLVTTQPYDAASCAKSAFLTRGIVTDASGNLITSANPAHSGQTLTVWLTGLGAATKDPNTGYTESTIRPELWLLNSPINKNSYTVIQNVLPSVQTTVLFAGPSNAYGLEQINFTFDLSVIRGGKLCGTALADDLGLAVRLASSPAGTGYSNTVRMPIVVQRSEFPCQ